MVKLRFCLLVSLLALGACSATPVPIPFADGGPTGHDMNYGGPDAAASADGSVGFPDSYIVPGPGCPDGGDATCGDASPTDAEAGTGDAEAGTDDAEISDADLTEFDAGPDSVLAEGGV